MKTDILDRRIQYWQSICHALSDATIAEIEKERSHLYKAVADGLDEPTLLHETGVLILQLTSLVERRNYIDEWLPLVTKAVTVCTADPYMQTRLIDLEGFLYATRKQYERAIPLYARVIDRAQTAGWQDLLARGHLHLCVAYQAMQKFDRAATHGQAAKQLLEENDTLTVDYPSVLNALGLLYAEQGDHAVAQAYFREAITLWENGAEKTWLARGWLNMGWSQMLENKLDAALLAFDQGIVIAHQAHNQLEASYIEINRGVCLLRLGKIETAAQAFANARTEAMQRSGDRFKQALLAHNFGEVKMLLGDYEEALALLQEAAVIWQQVDLPVHQLAVRGEIARVLARMGQVAQAKKLLEEVIAALGLETGDSAREQHGLMVAALDELGML